MNVSISQNIVVVFVVYVHVCVWEFRKIHLTVLHKLYHVQIQKVKTVLQFIFVTKMILLRVRTLIKEYDIEWICTVPF